MIERQITGEYRELEDDAWVVSSARTNVQKEKSGTAIAVPLKFFCILFFISLRAVSRIPM